MVAVVRVVEVSMRAKQVSLVSTMLSQLRYSQLGRHRTNRSRKTKKHRKLIFFMNLSPGDELVYNVSDGKADIMQYIKLTNTSGVSLAYKVIYNTLRDCKLT